VDALSQMIEATRPGGQILDLQVIRPDPVIELDGHPIAHIDGEPLFLWADAAVAAIDERISLGELVQEAFDDHDIREYYADGRELAGRFVTSKRRLSDEALRVIQPIVQPLAVRERCRTRLLRVR
jgi:hypothetical protein